MPADQRLRPAHWLPALAGALLVGYALAFWRRAAIVAGALGALCCVPLLQLGLRRYGRARPDDRHDDTRHDAGVRLLIGAGLVACAIAMPGPRGALAVLAGGCAAFVVLGARGRRAAATWLGQPIPVAALLAIGVAAAWLLLPTMSKVREKANRSNCKGNLKMLGLSLLLYRDNQGLAVNYPAFDGSDFLIHLYVVENTTVPDLYLCPSSGDTNADGADIRLGNTRCTSYAGRRNRIQERYPGLFTAEA